MPCLDLTNGFFALEAWINAPSTNMGGITVIRTPTQISVQKAGLSGSENAFGDFLYAVFGGGNFVALLKRNSGGGLITWTVSVVDVSGSSIGSTLLFSVNLASSQSPPRLAVSPGNGRLAFFWSGTGNLNEAFNMMIVRSDDGSVVLAGPGTISNHTGIDAEITATELVIHHPNSGSNDDTTGPRPLGSLTVTPANRDFGEAVMGADDPSLATVTQPITLRNDGSDCLTINGITNVAPDSLTPASVAMLTVVLDPGEEITADVVFAPTSTGNNISR